MSAKQFLLESWDVYWRTTKLYDTKWWYKAYSGSLGNADKSVTRVLNWQPVYGRCRAASLQNISSMRTHLPFLQSFYPPSCAKVRPYKKYYPSLREKTSILVR